MPFQIVVKKCW